MFRIIDPNRLKLTKQKALDIAVELWTWLYFNPDAAKHEWPGWKDYGTMSHTCPLCEVAEQLDSQYVGGTINHCHFCPIQRWTSGNAYTDCVAPGSPFVAWRDGVTIEDRRKAALDMVELLQSGYRRYWIDSRGIRRYGRRRRKHESNQGVGDSTEHRNVAVGAGNWLDGHRRVARMVQDLPELRNALG